MMTRTLTLLPLLMLAACSGGERDDDVEGFVPPTVRARGDYQAQLERRFGRLDRNGDDAVTADELPRRNPARVSGLDSDGDGRVTRREFVDGRLQRFDRADLDRNGSLTTEERKAAGQRP